MPHTTDVPVTWGDTDAGGLIYFPRFFHFFVTGLNAYFEPVAPHLMDHLRREDLVLPAVDCSASFSAPLRAGETARIETTVEDVGTSSLACSFLVTRAADGEQAADGEVTFVLVDQAFEPCALPDEVRACAVERGDE